MTIEQEVAQAVIRRVRQSGADDGITVENIRPSALSSLPLDKQAGMIRKVKEDINGSWAFFGAPGAGKTTLSNLLFKEAVFDRVVTEFKTGTSLPPSLWRITARDLCQQTQDRATGRDLEDDEEMCIDIAGLLAQQAKIINRERFQRAVNAGLRPRLFIEEFDKISATKFQLLSMFDALDAITSLRGQLVMTSNLTWDQFCTQFGGTSWRIEQNCNIAQMFPDCTGVQGPRAKTLRDW